MPWFNEYKPNSTILEDRVTITVSTNALISDTAIYNTSKLCYQNSHSTQRHSGEVHVHINNAHKNCVYQNKNIKTKLQNVHSASNWWFQQQNWNKLVQKTRVTLGKWRTITYCEDTEFDIHQKHLIKHLADLKHENICGHMLQPLWVDSVHCKNTYSHILHHIFQSCQIVYWKDCSISNN